MAGTCPAAKTTRLGTRMGTVARKSEKTFVNTKKIAQFIKDLLCLANVGDVRFGESWWLLWFDHHLDIHIHILTIT